MGGAICLLSYIHLYFVQTLFYFTFCAKALLTQILPDFVYAYDQVCCWPRKSQVFDTVMVFEHKHKPHEFNFVHFMVNYITYVEFNNYLLHNTFIC